MCIFHFYCSVFLVFVLPSGVIKNDKNYKYKMIQQDRIIELDREDQIKDLGVILTKIWTLACILLKELIKPIACYG